MADTTTTASVAAQADAERRVEPTQVIYSGAPSQRANAPAIIACLLALLGAACSPLHGAGWWAPWVIAAAVAMVVTRLVVRVAATRIEVDDRRIVLTEGIMDRKQSSLELIRVQDVTADVKWWEQLLGIGTVIVDSSDLVNPHWEFEGIPNPEAVRDTLNKVAFAARKQYGVRETNIGHV